MSKVYLGRDNTITLSHQTDGSATDFSSVTSMVLTLLDDSNVQVTSTTSDDKIDFSTNGTLIFKLGAESIPVGRYPIELVAVTGANNTQLIHEDDGIVFDVIQPAAIS